MAKQLVLRHDGKGGNEIERCVISTFRVAASMGFKGDFRPMHELPESGDLITSQRLSSKLL